MDYSERVEKHERIRILLGVIGLAAVLLLPNGWMKIAAAVVTYAIAGWETAREAVENLIHGRMFDESLLMVIATVGAAILGEWSEAAAVMVFFSVGEWVQELAEERSRKSVSALLALTPDTARVIREGREVTVSPESVQIGEICILHPGERIPLDGVITEGRSSIDVSALTGESLPADCAAGDTVMSGSMILDGAVRLRVTKQYGESSVQRILNMVENAVERKAKTERFITRFARIYTPCVVFAAVLIGIFPPLILHADWMLWIHRALMLLVVSCPCALVLSVPLTYFAGIGGAAHVGILVKGAGAFDALSRVKIAAFDKTGTLTTGNLRLDGVFPQNCTADELLRTASLAEASSDHPLAKAIRRAYPISDASAVTDYRALSGLGISCRINGKPVLAGNAKLIPEASDVGTTAIHLAENGIYLGYLTFTDEPKAETAQALADLKACGVRKTVLLTGDVSAKALDGCHLDEIHTSLLPEDKCRIAETLSLEGTLMFTGDGINDAPVLSRADVGIAMGALGSDAAMEAADIVLIRDDPRDAAKAVRIGRRTVQIVRENIIFALLVKLAVMVLCIAGRANMWQAVFADAGVAVLCVLNAARAAYKPAAKFA